MKLNDMLITEEDSIKSAIERLEKARCKVVYVVKERKLLASISDGDVRRFTLHAGDINQKVSSIANYFPCVVNAYDKGEMQRIFQETELYSIPLTNLNDEIVGVAFRNGTVVKERGNLDAPVVMMAGGKGTRLHPYTKILPKALIPIGEIPISEHILNRFYENGCTEFYLVVNHMSGMIQSYFDNIEKNYLLQYVEEEQALGTGGGLSLLKGKIKQDFILTNCDILIDADYTAIYKMHQKKGNFITIVLSKYTANIPYGVVEIDGGNNYQKVVEKPSFEYLINTGVYIVNAKVIEELPDNQVINFPDIIEKYRLAGEKIGCYVVSESAYMDMGQFEELEKMKEKLNVQ